jgi:hypothetical protein
MSAVTVATADPSTICSVCQVSRACVVCCRVSLCLLHAHATKHSQHPSLWKVTDTVERDRTRASVESARARAIASIERDLAALEATEDSALQATRIDREEAAPQLEEDDKSMPLAITTNTTAAAAAARAPLLEFIIAPGETQRLAAAVRGAAPARRSAWFDDDGEGSLGSHSSSRSRSPPPPPTMQMMFLMPSQRAAKAAAEAKALNKDAPSDVTETADAFAAHSATVLAVRQAVQAREVEAATAAIDSFDTLGNRARATVAAGLWARLRAGVDTDAAALAGAPRGTIGERSAMTLAKSALASPALLRDFSRAIEVALWETTDGIKEEGDEGEGEREMSLTYTTQARVLMTALGDARNNELRARVIGGEISARRLATLDSTALAPAVAVRDAEAARARAANETDLTAAAESTWGQPHASVLCTQCSERGGVQMREGAGLAQRDIRKAEIWGGSATDMSSTDLRCTFCAHGWNVDSLGLMMLLQAAQLSIPPAKQQII